MKTTRLRHLLGWSLAACLAASGGIALGAPPADQTQSPEANQTQTPEANQTQTPEANQTQTPEANQTQTPEASQTPMRITNAHKISTTATIQAIDHRDRALTLSTDQGNTFTVDVPQSVTRFDALKKGDRIHIDYFESMAVSLNKGGAGAQPGQRQSTTVQRNGGVLPGGIAARKITTTAKVLSVDPAHATVTVQGPSGNVETIDVPQADEQQQLANLKAGDQIQVSYIQAVAIDVTPGPGAQQPGGQAQGAQPPGAQQPGA